MFVYKACAVQHMLYIYILFCITHVFTRILRILSIYGRYQVPGTRYQVPGARCQVPGARPQGHLETMSTMQGNIYNTNKQWSPKLPMKVSSCVGSMVNRRHWSPWAGCRCPIFGVWSWSHIAVCQLKSHQIHCSVA